MKPVKTEFGNVAFKARSPLMSVRQRVVYLLCDGSRSVDAILAATGTVGAVRDDLDHLVEQGFLTVKPPILQPPESVALATPTETMSTLPPEGKRKDRSLYVENWTMF